MGVSLQTPHERTLLIRADASVAMGTGHVMRCLALAQSWQDGGGRAVFAMATPPALLRDRLSQESIEVREISASAGSSDDAHATATLARDCRAVWIAVDGYHFGADYQQSLRSEGVKVLFLDDYGHAAYYTGDIVLNQNLSAEESTYKNRESYTRLLLGPEYCLLRREFSGYRNWKREITPAGARVLITMGGSDPENFTERAISALNLAGDQRLEAAVVAGSNNAQLEPLERISKAGKNITLHRSVINMAALMEWADVAISAAGTTCWELCLMGLPSLLVDLAENQISVARELNRRGCAIHLGNSRDVSAEKIAEQLRALLNSQRLRQAMSERCRGLVDGRGAQRVVAALR
jgi:UDP-2,4-diacetamido-2,4,6-trideoxy-beta-L-altropyranose hydrolase